MKTKPTRHKKANTFQFKSFSERIEEINIDIFHRVRHKNEGNNEEPETYFHQTLQKWNVLNLTDSYNAFKKEVRDIVTLPQLIYKEQHVVDTLMEYLKKRDPLFLQPILELVVAIAKDLQRDFYERYFSAFFSEIIHLLQTKNAEQIEYAFTTVAHLFKQLWRFIVRDVKPVIPLLLPLLSDTQPVYINKFAAESFAFVVRKILNKDEFFKKVLDILKDNTDDISGCGKLFFEVVFGVAGQFHSCGEQMLLIYFNALQDQSINQKIAYEVLKEIVVCILQNIHSQKCDIMWDVILKMTDKFIESSKQPLESSNRKHALILVLRLMYIIISYKNGKFVTDSVSLIKRFIIIMNTLNKDNNILQEVFNVSIAILLASHVKLMHENSSQLLLKMMAVDNIELLYFAVEKLMHNFSFEVLILPRVLRRCISVGFDSEMLLLFAKIILNKASPCLNGINLSKWEKYVLDVRNIKAESIDYFLLELKTLSTDNVSLDAMRLLIILPHLKPLDEKFKTVLKNEWLFIYQKILKYDSTEDIVSINRTCFIFLLILESIIHISEPSELHEFFVKSNVTIIDLVNKYDNKFILNAIDLCLTYFSTSEYHANYINSAFFDALNNIIVKRLSSPYSSIRLIVAHLYSLFSNVEDLRRSSIQDNNKTAMELVYLAECEPTTVDNYRTKLLRLQALEFQSPAIVNLNPKYYEFPLRCLIGNLYVNFSLLWRPISIVIAGYGNKECPQFWPTFLAELTFNSVPQIEWKPSFDCHVISSLESLIEKHDDKPDFENYKKLLWKSIAHFSYYAEMKNRDLTGLFINFINTNFSKSNSEDGKYCNIKKHKDVINANNDSNDESEEEEERIEIIKTAQADTKSRSDKVKYLLAQMEVFEKVLNPKMLHREAEMYQIYLDLLSSKNADIQKAALNCLFAYKHEYLLPYKESLYSLISEKNLKNELARFKLDRESNVIKEIHRKNLMPIILRIIYAKMIMKIGMRTGGKASGLERRKMILRFLSGTEEDEMILFIQMVFRPFKSYISLEMEDEAFDLKRYIENIIDTTDLSNVIPPKRMQSAVKLLAIMMEEFGGKMSTRLLPCLLRMLICILAEVTGILHKSDEVYSGYLPTIKNVRTSCIDILTRFFKHFEDYNWKRCEIDAVYHVAVFPWLQKLPIEGIHSPTALLKLFMAWSENPRYHPLFAKHREDDESITPLPYIVQLLLNPKTHQSVVNAILLIIENLLTLQDYKQSNEDSMQVEVPLFPILTNLLDVEKKGVLPNGMNYGSAILLPHVPRILQFLKNKLERSNRGLNKTELLILSQISEYVTDAETCDRVLKLILPILAKKAFGNNKETITELLTTVVNLVKIANKPEIYLRAIAPLMSVVLDIPIRKLLLQLYGAIAERSSEEYREAMIRDRDVLLALNAWDKKWIDQPDFERRLGAFDEISKMTERNAITLEFGVTVIHNCFYFLKTESDLAIRDYAAQCLKLVGCRLAKEHCNNASNKRYLMDDTILALTRKGIVSKNENVRLQSIALLGYMALECADVHPILRDMSLLVNATDREVDFFENMQHLQLYRRARALLKFCALAKTSRKPFDSRTLTQFILPLCSTYLCNEAFINKNSVIDAAIDTIGIVCRFLPWYHYEIILKHYLNKLKRSVEFQKQLIRIVVAILDSFHYDLSKYKEVQQITQVEVTLENNATLIDKEKINEEINEDANVEDKETEEILDEALNDENVENVEEVEQDNEAVKEDLPIIEKQMLLSQSGAKKVMFSISNNFLPQLNRFIIARTQQESSHKINKKTLAFEMEEDDLLRVPISIALVKLLQKMPGNLLDANLPGIFMKLCTFLKSRMESVRRTTRKTLQEIMIALGPKYLHYLLKEMNTLLTKGFQVHVLAYTVQSVLVALKPYFQKFDVDYNLQSILSVCKVDLFGLTAEEKEIAGIVKNVSEAKSTKSFDIFHILAEYITETCLLDLILPLKEMLMKTHSYKTINKITECFQNISLGLVDNTYIPLEQMLKFLYGIISQSIPDLILEKDDKNLEEKKTRYLEQQQSDCFIIPSEPKNRMGIKATAKITKHANIHIIIEFGLTLYHILLKRNKISCMEYKPYLEPFMPVLGSCLNSHHVKLCTVALKCLSWMLKMDLTSTSTSISGICTSMFAILHKYATAELSKGDNFDLVQATFKCMSMVVEKHCLDKHQLKLLIMYAEEDLNNNDKPATAFALLKIIINRKIFPPTLHIVMKKVAELSILAELEDVRLQSRALFFSYLMKYPHTKKHLRDYIEFYLAQFEHEGQSGRLSALKMIHTVIKNFPSKSLSRLCESIFMDASFLVTTDVDLNCRELSAKCIEELLIRVPAKRDKLFRWTIDWLSDSDIEYRQIGVRICGIFVATEKKEFDSRFDQFLPLLLKQFHENFSVSDKEEPGKFVKLDDNSEKNSNIEPHVMERLKDCHIIQVTFLLLKIAEYTSFLTNEKYKDSMDILTEHCQSLLGHLHFWVRLNATKFIGYVLESTFDNIVKILNNSEIILHGYMYSTPLSLKDLVLDLIDQLYPDMTFELLADQVVKCLIIIAKIFTSIKTSDVQDIDLSLSWLIRNVRKAVNVEITQAPKSTSVRKAVFKFIAGIVIKIPTECLHAILFSIMSPLVREITITEETNVELRQVAKEVLSLIKKAIGNEEYVKLLNRVQQKLDIKKAERKKAHAQQFVVNPDLAAKRKLAKQQKKKESKKRKMDNIKEKKIIKKRRKVNLDELNNV